MTSGNVLLHFVDGNYYNVTIFNSLTFLQTRRESDFPITLHYKIFFFKLPVLRLMNVFCIV